MKKNIILSLSVLALAMASSSCSKNDDTPKDPMLGHWVIDKYSTTKPGETSAEKDYTNPDCAPNKNYIDLKASSTLEMGNVNSSCELTKAPGTWALTDDLLVLKGAAVGTMNLYVTSVTASTMTLKMLTVADGSSYYTLKLVKQ